jgi:hypothetical protein
MEPKLATMQNPQVHPILVASLRIPSYHVSRMTDELLETVGFETLESGWVTLSRKTPQSAIDGWLYRCTH